MISFVPLLIYRQKWHDMKGEVNVGDIVFFLKNEKEYEEQYHYGKVYGTHTSKDDLIRKVDIEYKNSNEETEGNSSGWTRAGCYFSS